jgi:phosphoribosylformimino-5-aminoimidazole carboxamide ribonucleotide (ProFAR) isomerase
VGRIVGHPCLLRGSIPSIVQDARRAEQLGVDGVNLLAYRYDGDVEALVESVVEAISIPVIAAGSVDSTDRVRALSERGVSAFTVGTAALDGRFAPGRPLAAQLDAILTAADRARA